GRALRRWNISVWPEGSGYKIRNSCRLPLGVRHKRNIVNLPSPHRMRDTHVNLSAFCGIVDVCMKVAGRFKELRLERDLPLHVNWTRRCSELFYSTNKVLDRKSVV